MAGGNITLSAQLFTELGLDTKVSRNRVLDFYKDFKSELAVLMKDLSDEDIQEVNIGGTILSKGSSALAYYLPEYLSEQEFIFSQLLDGYKFEQSLENKINNISFT